ncbi:Txe/YoeB family addiction module toxin [Dyadobacter chenwenxiniae]|uniref:Putative mRNA interferase YoeB n=1 Tax=Dyadobacter chenwenxiniae TaxID=2906456 RepID=A0A9X1PUB5_9BACT|nr:Txe/YoeB family addiction module toxin [Dyadobacter chenwenxiniae]MCF0065763.1 Txe/YoeB family addiction module toxin [Dyadobacter chenwenxiniae]UON84135.1 Txe/YoeB family addiction module toxin [Dyadobacter chenwenxiniae]
MGRYSVTFSDRAKKDLSFLHKSGGKSLVKRIERIFEELGENPYSGIGKPEQLKNNLSGLWSRRIDKKHRLVYQIIEQTVTVFVIAAKGHYDDK